MTSAAPDLFSSAEASDLPDRLRLIRSHRVGPATYRRLMAEHGCAAAALAALPGIALEAGVKDYEPFALGAALHEIETGIALGARLLTEDDPAYPAKLAEIDDAPPLIWTLGDPALAARPCLAMVGARNASSLGLRMARKLAAELGEEGYTIVSGLARGIDAAAHQASLATGTIAVLAGGVDDLYPRENAELGTAIGQQGLRLSEMPIGLSPQARHFPRRNRLISGLAEAVIVIEAASKSGSLITARDALDQGRDVMAVPGHPFDARASGCNMLIRDGATLVRGADDVIAALARPKPEVPQPAPPPVQASPRQSTTVQGDLPALILSLLSPSPIAEDLVIRESGAPVPQVLQTLTELELDNRIERLPGGYVALA